MPQERWSLTHLVSVDIGVQLQLEFRERMR
jgi:hypothetical protein